MAHEENADAVAKALRQRNFPVFVVKSEANHLYLVIVGPYDNANKTAEAKAALEKQGFEVIPTEWTTQAQ